MPDLCHVDWLWFSISLVFDIISSQFLIKCNHSTNCSSVINQHYLCRMHCLSTQGNLPIDRGAAARASGPPQTAGPVEVWSEECVPYFIRSCYCNVLYCKSCDELGISIRVGIVTKCCCFYLFMVRVHNLSNIFYLLFRHVTLRFQILIVLISQNSLTATLQLVIHFYQS